MMYPCRAYNNAAGLVMDETVTIPAKQMLSSLEEAKMHNRLTQGIVQ